MVDKLVHIVIEEVGAGQLVGEGGGLVRATLVPQGEGEHVVLQGEILHPLLGEIGADLAVVRAVLPVRPLEEGDGVKDHGEEKCVQCDVTGGDTSHG